MAYDIENIVIMTIVIIVGLVYVFVFLKRNFSYKESYNLLIIGTIFLIIPVIINSLVEGNWNVEFVIDFLSLKKVGIWVFRYTTSIGYTCIFWGIVFLICLKIKIINAKD